MSRRVGGVRKVERHAQTDAGNAFRLEDRYQDRLRWVTDEKAWAVYDPTTGLWERNAEARAYGLARTTVERMAAEEARQYPEGDERKAWFGFCKRSQSDGAIRAMLSSARSRRRLMAKSTDFDANPYLLHCTNGVLDLRPEAPRMIKHSPEHLLTRSTRVRLSSKASSARWDAYLRKFVPDPEVRRFVQKLAGYTLLHGNPERLFLFIYGPSTSGKSTFREMLLMATGDHGRAVNLSLFRTSQSEKPRPDIIDAYRARFVTASEAKAEWELHADHIKQITGADTMSQRDLYKGYGQGKPPFTPWIFTNHMPTIKGRDIAFDRRVRAVKFGVSVIKGEKTNLSEEMKEDVASREAVLAWMVRGLVAYRREGLVPPAQVVKDTEEALSQLNSLSHFIATQCRTGPGRKGRPQDLFEGYWEWCETQKLHDRDRLDGKKFGSELEGLGYVRKRESSGDRAWYRMGIELRHVRGLPVEVTL